MIDGTSNNEHEKKTKRNKMKRKMSFVCLQLRQTGLDGVKLEVPRYVFIHSLLNSHWDIQGHFYILHFLLAPREQTCYLIFTISFACKTGFFLLIIAIFLARSALWFIHRDDDSREKMGKNIMIEFYCCGAWWRNARITPLTTTCQMTLLLFSH